MAGEEPCRATRCAAAQGSDWDLLLFGRCCAIMIVIVIIANTYCYDHGSLSLSLLFFTPFIVIMLSIMIMFIDFRTFCRYHDHYHRCCRHLL